MKEKNKIALVVKRGDPSVFLLKLFSVHCGASSLVLLYKSTGQLKYFKILVE